MAESTLSAKFKDLTGEVGFELGYGRGADNGDPTWNTEQQNAVTRCTKGALRRVYFCGYQWTFLQPTKTLSLPSGANTIPLPDDVGGLEGNIFITSPTGTLWWSLMIGNIGDVYQHEADYPTSTGRPEYACVEPYRAPTALSSDRQQLHFWPLANTDYTIKVRYYIRPDYLDGSFPYAYGGPEHTETFLAAARAVAELVLDGIADGPMEMHFQRVLEQSKIIDQRLKPQTLGYNGDRSDYKDARYGGLAGRFNQGYIVTFNGQTP